HPRQGGRPAIRRSVPAGDPGLTGRDGGLTLPPLKGVGFSVPRSRPSCDGLTRSPRAFAISRDDPVPVCPTVRIWQGRLPTVPAAEGCRAWSSPRRRSLFLSRFSAGKVFLPATGRTLSFQRGPQEDIFPDPLIHPSDQHRTPSSHP